MLTLWIVGGVVLLLVLTILFGPIGIRLTLVHPYNVALRVSWIGIPVYRWSFGPKAPGRRKKKRRAAPRGGARRKGVPGFREGRALIAVLRTPGVARLLWDTARRAVDALELVKGELYLALGFRDRSKTGGLAALIGAIGPRFTAGHGKLKLELAPDFQGRTFSADGELSIRTLPISWISLGLSLLFSETAREGWRVWKAELNRKPKAKDDTPA